MDAIGFILLTIFHSFVPVPAEILAVANGMIFGPIWGTVITWVGAMLGAYLAFGLSRALGQPLAQAMVPERHRRTLDEWTLGKGERRSFSVALFQSSPSMSLITLRVSLISPGGLLPGPPGSASYP